MRPARRPFGSGPPVSAFTLGTMRALESPDHMAAVLGAAMGAGINHLETAPAYGPAEPFLGQALRQLQSQGLAPEGGWLITSKILPGCDLAAGQEQLRSSLRRLGVARLDGLAVHGLNTPEHLIWADRGPGADLLQWALDTGLATQVGFTSHGSPALIAEALATGRFRFCSLHVHLFDQTRLPLARAALDAGIGVLAISPADKGGRLYDPPPQLLADCAPFHPLELAYRFLLDQGISTLSLGAAQPADLVWAERWWRGALAGDGASRPRLAAALERLGRAGAERLGADRCGQCRACLPCPNGVPIPELLRLRNLAVGHGMEAFAQERYNLIGRAGHWWETLNAEACQACGACLPRCPHGLPIPTLLADTHRRLAAAPRRRLWG
ncbi:aldo/keto reductase [Cyanobium sp. NIES-981]|uniref:aldo/keto reductase n=1 Tax=Cyanobium sp. NIES-981 TaxID=1851505 RepID=UPI000B3605E9|nr:aldo/keto reductase [Cyanobium sp. NIES-981]